MTALDSSVPDITGAPPILSGRTCNGLICEQFWDHGALHSAASVIYVKADEIWHRLVLDAGIIHWREQSVSPEPWEVAEEGWAYPHLDLANQEELIGLEFTGYVMRASESGCSVEFEFSDSRRLIFQEARDVVTWAVI